MVAMPSGYYYFGGYDMNTKEITVLMVEPGKHPMLMQGVNVKVAQEHLGHKDISTTMNIYSHVLPSVAKEAAQKIGALVYEAG